jgi:hypothetical protein
MVQQLYAHFKSTTKGEFMRHLGARHQVETFKRSKFTVFLWVGN